MTGTPSSRACDACRKLKKKFNPDWPTLRQMQAPWNRLCIGSGQQRYKFVVQKRIEQLAANSPAEAAQAAAMGMPLAKRQAQFLIVEGMLLSIALFLNSMLFYFAECHEKECEIATTKKILIDQVLGVLETIIYLRPLRSEGFLLALALAWSAAKDSSTERRLEDTIAVSTQPHTAQALIVRAQWTRSQFASLRERYSGSGQGRIKNQVSATTLGFSGGEPASGRCVIL